MRAKLVIQFAVFGSLLIAQEQTRDLGMAIRLSRAAAKRQLESLKSTALSSTDSMERLIASYLLYKINPVQYADLFTRSFPTSKVGITRFFGLYTSIPYSESAEGTEYRYPHAKWTIGFWSIYHAYLERVKAGDPIALKRFLQLEGSGDGEVGEGIASDILDFFLNPKFALAHWQALEPHKQYLRSVNGWVPDDAFKRIRREYSEALPLHDPRRTVILELLDTPE